ncbi:hypothetical protein ETB97_003221 [Aspergillus alliaceus]|uniref:Uncharacterized protein n=1 Tax=Petromyces alliaceus TaxID=209559 RepID=A0A8H6E4H9_PETAA|nr:hypothetical protein ETB97_003221 [Aspergillus burnettii]
MANAPNYEKEVRIASLAVQRASILTKTIQNEIHRANAQLPDGSPVAIVQFASQVILMNAILHHFPSDRFAGEKSASALRDDPVLARRVWELVSMAKLGHIEGEDLVVVPGTLEEMLGSIDAEGDGERPGAQRTWFLGPIDGTKTFMRGQQYAVSLTLVESGEQKVGVVGYPNLAFENRCDREDVVVRDGYGIMLSAVKGQGAYKRWMAQSSLQPPQRNSLGPWRRMGETITFAESSISHVVNKEKHRFIRSMLLANPVVDLHSMQVRYAALATGACNAMICLPKDKNTRFPAWEHAGGMLIFEESGGIVTDLYGRPFNYARGTRLTDNEGLVAAKPGLHVDLLRYSRHIYEKDLSSMT